MSARRRQETLERFSIPIEEGSEDAIDFPPTPTASQTSSLAQSQSTTRLSRRRGAGSSATLATEDSAGLDDGDDDFVPDGGDDDDDDFIVSDDDTPWGKSKKSKGKGKKNAKPIAKGKSKAKARFAKEDSFATYESPSVASGANPKVMLISLKAGALGLNLTVANNVYLMDP